MLVAFRPEARVKNILIDLLLKLNFCVHPKEALKQTHWCHLLIFDDFLLARSVDICRITGVISIYNGSTTFRRGRLGAGRLGTGRLALDVYAPGILGAEAFRCQR